MIQRDFPGSGATLSGLGGVNTGRDAAEFILLGSNTVQARGRWLGCLPAACWEGMPAVDQAASWCVGGMQ